MWRRQSDEATAARCADDFAFRGATLLAAHASALALSGLAVQVLDSAHRSGFF